MTVLLLLALQTLAFQARNSRSAALVQTAYIAAGARVVMDSNRAMTVSVYRNGRRIWSGVPQKWKPWRLAVADVDGDGLQEIVVGLFKRTRFFPEPHNCLFVYGFTGKSVKPKWLGSRLSLPFVDFRFANLDADRADELVALERRPDGRLRAAVYSWSGFGFDLDREYGPWRSARISAASRDRVTLTVDGRAIVLREVRK